GDAGGGRAARLERDGDLRAAAARRDRARHRGAAAVRGARGEGERPRPPRMAKGGVRRGALAASLAVSRAAPRADPGEGPGRGTADVSLHRQRDPLVGAAALGDGRLSEHALVVQGPGDAGGGGTMIRIVLSDAKVRNGEPVKGSVS